MVFNTSSTDQFISRCAICFGAGLIMAPTMFGTAPLAGAVCCLLQPLVFKVSSLALEKLKDSEFVKNHIRSNKEKIEWTMTLLVPSLIAWQQGLFSLNPFTAMAMQLASIGTVAIAREISLFK